MPSHYITLVGQHALLLPLEHDHLEDLSKAASDGLLWELFFTTVPSPNTIASWFEKAMEQQTKDLARVFTVIDKERNQIIGSTRYCNMDSANKRLEIGYTWYAQTYQRSVFNTECKLLLLTHAFEIMDCNAVEFRTDWFNQRSQKAIERLGAKRDGVLRSHMILPDGRVRDTVVYSILKHEWPGVKANLQFKLSRDPSSSTHLSKS
ncbi:GNAT family N-acetyltransferase [Undibacterium fentianense]|uniref:GNAT family N-acetyltransferase n=1 Tax=Undibacterium fentianense TaxID=2828728 RepID=A0A941IGE4_9BURK|nr:GNAT family protein [Undibacterium fentianense]MBR7801287.1 GNAT family N-acetyltransferase [Undibacterium fentianense]